MKAKPDSRHQRVAKASGCVAGIDQQLGVALTILRDCEKQCLSMKEYPELLTALDLVEYGNLCSEIRRAIAKLEPWREKMIEAMKKIV